MRNEYLAFRRRYEPENITLEDLADRRGKISRIEPLEHLMTF